MLELGELSSDAGTGHHSEEKINSHYFALETELRPVGGIYKKPTFGSI